MNKWWGSIIAAGGSLLTIFTPQIQAVIAAHPAVSAVIAGIYAVITHIMPSPVSDVKTGG